MYPQGHQGSRQARPVAAPLRSESHGDDRRASRWRGVVGAAAAFSISCPPNCISAFRSILGCKAGGRAHRALSSASTIRGSIGSTARRCSKNARLFIQSEWTYARVNHVSQASHHRGHGLLRRGHDLCNPHVQLDFSPRAHQRRARGGRLLPPLRPARDEEEDGRGLGRRAISISVISVPTNNLFTELEDLFRGYGEPGAARSAATCTTRRRPRRSIRNPARSREWQDIPTDSDLMFYEGLHGAVVTPEVNVARHADLIIGVVPIINLEWIQKLHRDKRDARLLDRGGGRHHPAAYAGLRAITSARSSRRPTSIFSACRRWTRRILSPRAIFRRPTRASWSSASQIRRGSTFPTCCP